LPVSHIQRDDARVPSPPAETAVESLELPSLSGISVLIVDDEPDGRVLISRILEAHDAKTTCAANAQEAMDWLERHPFDVLLSDIGMPGVDGYALIRQVRALDSARVKPLTAIAVTAYARPEDRQRSLLAGYQMHLSKPVEARELIAAIASLLHLKR